MRFINAMKGHRRWRWAIAMIAATTVGLAFAGQVRAAPQGGAPAFSAVELADALLFDDGPAAKYLTALDRPKLERTDELVKTKEVVDKAIAADEKWGASFAERIQSGDPNRIQPAVADLYSLSRTALDDLYGKEVVDKALAEGANGGASSRALIYQTVLFIYKWVFVVRHIAVYWNFTDFQDPATNPRLVDEVSIRVIAENLATKVAR